MAVARLKSEWDQTAQLWSLIANCNKDPKKPAVLPSEVHPFRDEKEYKPKPIEGAGISALKLLIKAHENA